MIRFSTLLASTCLALAACAEHDPLSIAAPGRTGLSEARVVASPDPKTTWKLPLADASLALRSDRLYGDNTYSVYADGTCGVTSSIHAVSGTDTLSGDATFQSALPSKGKCGRTITLVYPDGFSESVASFANVHVLESGSFAITIGSSMKRRLTINPGDVVNRVTPRCSKLQFGAFGASGGVGSDSVIVTRVDSSTWQVQSQSAPNDKAFCETNAALYHMQVSFTVTSSYPLR